jgi:hypothetical protein
MDDQISIPFPKSKAAPGQLRHYDNRDDRVELVRLLKHLSPARRVRFLRWACAQARVPAVVGLNTYALAAKAASCSEADEALTMDVLFSLCHLAMESELYKVDLSACLTHLVAMVRGKD